MQRIGPLLVLAFFACKSQERFCPEGAEEKTGPNTRHCKKGKVRHGPQVRYFDNGVEQSRSEWKDGKRDGIFIERHEDGRLMQKSIWKAGRFVRYDFPEPGDEAERKVMNAFLEAPLPKGCLLVATYPRTVRDIVPEVPGYSGIELQYGGAIVGNRKISRSFTKIQFEQVIGREVPGFTPGSKFYIKRCRTEDDWERDLAERINRHVAASRYGSEPALREGVQRFLGKPWCGRTEEPPQTVRIELAEDRGTALGRMTVTWDGSQATETLIARSRDDDGVFFDAVARHKTPPFYELTLDPPRLKGGTLHLPLQPCVTD